MKICVLPGDGIGPEIMAQAVRVLNALDLKFEMEEALVGGCAVDATGNPLPEATLELARAADAILLGAVGGPKWDSHPRNQRPELGLLGIRKELALFANLRPAILYLNWPTPRRSSPRSSPASTSSSCGSSPATFISASRAASRCARSTANRSAWAGTP